MEFTLKGQSYRYLDTTSYFNNKYYNQVQVYYNCGEYVFFKTLLTREELAKADTLEIEKFTYTSKSNKKIDVFIITKSCASNNQLLLCLL